MTIYELGSIAAVMIALCLVVLVLRLCSTRVRRWMDQRMAEGDWRLEERRR